jgi:hypothetical protein
MATSRPPLRGTAIADSTGVARITFTVRGSQSTRYTQFSCEMANPGSGKCTLRFNDGLVCPFPNAAADAVGGYPPVDVDPGDKVEVVWTGVPAGQLGTSLAFWEPIDA